jgi:RHS repeat-associated protein
MKDLNKIFWLVAVMTLGNTVASAQYYTVVGPSPVTIGTSTTYSYSIDPADAFDTFFISPYWDANGGTITSSYLSNGNLTANVVVQWNVTGTFNLHFYGFNFSQGRPPSGTIAVTVNCASIGTPTGASQLSPICGSGSTQLSVSVGSGGTSLRWYAAASGGSPLPSGVTYTTPSISSSTTYYVSSYNGGCESSRLPVTATVTSVPSAPTSLGGARCGTGQVVISASAPAGASISWENSGGTVLATGTSYTTPSHSNNVTYYARSYVNANGGTCYSATRTPVVATVNPIPAVPIGLDPIQACAPGTFTLVGDPGLNGNSIRWYTASSGGGPINAVQTVSSTTTFWGSSYNTNTGCESASRLSATITLTPPGLPTNPQQDTPICGSGSTLIWATPGANSNSLRWYTNSTGGSPFNTGASYQTPTISTNTTYYISSYNTSIGCESGRVPITTTISAIPGNPTMTDATRCGTGSVTLTGTPGTNAATVEWYTAAESPVGIATTSFTTPSLSTSRQYKVKSLSADGCLSPNFVPVNAIINPTIAIPSVMPASRCGGGSVTLAASPGSGTTGIQWESSSGTVLGTGTTFTTPSLSVTTDYYVRSTLVIGGTCLSDRVQVAATVNPIPAVPLGLDPIQACSPGTFTLIGDVGLNGNALRWYTASSGGSPISEVQTVSSTTTFWGSNYNTNTGCESTSRLSATITLTPPGLPTNPQQDVPICGSGNTLLWATPGVNTNSLRWYTNSTGGSPLSTSSSYQTPTISVTTTYYISSYNTSIGCESTRIPITATISPLPGDPIMTDATRCGTGSVTLTGTPGPNATTIEWYTAAESPVGIAATSFNTPSLSTSRQYKVKSLSADGCLSLNFVTVNAIVNPTIAIPAVTPASRCGEGSVTLSATPGSGATGLQWESSSGTVLGTSSTFTTPSLSVNTDYYVRSTLVAGGTCLSERVLVKATIHPVPAATTDPESVGSSYVHGHGSVILSSSFYSKWYTASVGGTYLGEGYFIETDDLSGPINFYHARYDAVTQCEGPRVALQADIRPLISNGFVKTENIRISGVTQDSQIAALTDAEKSTVIEHYDGLLRPVQQTFVRGSVSGKDVVQPIEYDPFGRAPKQYLPYVSAGTSGTFRPGYKTEQLDFYAAANDKIANDTQPFAISKFEPSPLGRILEQGGVGTGFQPGETQPHTAKASYSFNTGTNNSEAEEVCKFNTDGTSSGFYAANTLSRNETTDPDGNKIISFADGMGKTIMTKQQFDAASYLQTYYIYDDFGRIKYIVSPKGVNELRTNGWSLTPILKQYVHQFVYDALGRLIEKKVPGKDWEYFVYDKYNRLVLTQDSILRVSKQWIFQKYDIYGRAVMQGLYTNTVQNTRPLIQTLVNGLYKTSNASYPATSRYEDRGTTLHGYTNISFPIINQSGSALTITGINYYDTYDFDFNGTDDFSYTPQALPGEGTVPQGRSEGMPTGTKTLVLGTSTYLTSYVFYDKNGRMIQRRSNNLMNSVIDNLSTVTYDFEGKVISSRDYNRHAPDKTNRNDYDAAGRLKNIFGASPLSEPVQWATGTNLTITGTDLQKTGGLNNAWDAGTISTNYLAANENGWVEYKAGEINTYKMVGLAANNSSVSYSSINYSFYAAVSGALYVYESGTNKGTVGTYTVNDILSVERRNGQIIYRKNFQILYVSETPNTGALYADCALYTANASIKNVNLYRSIEFKIAQYEYNELGQLVDKKLHNTSGNNFLQSVDYRYNIRGQLTSINNAPLTNDGDLNDETTDHFGLEMMYHTIDAGLSNTPYHNGNISAIKWKGVGQATGNADQRSYQYTYDKANRLLSAASKMNSGSAWNKELNAFNESMTYDHNGNILSLQRNDRQHGLSGVIASYSSQQIDNLTYGYDVATGDRLKNVEDASAHAAGFSNLVNASTVKEFTYDGNGNVTADANKGMTATYNFLGKPTVINFSGGKKIEYTYDGAGNKLRMRILQDTTPLITTDQDTPLDTTDYVGDYVYDGGKLKFFGSPEGRIVMNGTQREYQYAIADHQGNTRVVFTSATQIPSAPVATFEGNATDQSSQYTMGGDVVTFFTANHTPSGMKVVRMNQTTPIGPSKSMKVYPGDKVDLEVWSYFEGNSGWGNSNKGMAALITNVATAFGGVSGGAGESGTIYSGVNTAYTTMGAAGNRGDAAPSAYLNYILYDKDYKFLNAGWKAIKPTSFTLDSIKFSTLNIKEPGYVFVYLSYEGESNQYVYFDDFKVTHTKTNVIQYNEYYPFGLQASTSWTRENSKNDFLYNAGSELNVTSGWYDLFFRNYDPALGRFMQVDPLATSEMATYQYAGNNPVLFNDPMGAARASYNKAYWMSEQMVGGNGGFYDSDRAGGGGGLGGGSWAKSTTVSAEFWKDLVGASADGVTTFSGEDIATVYDIWSDLEKGAGFNFRYGDDGSVDFVTYSAVAGTDASGVTHTSLKGSAFLDPFGAQQEKPLSHLEVLHSSNRLDIFRETTFYPSPTSMIIEMNTVFVEYNKNGTVSAYNGYKTMQKIVIYENIRYVGNKEFSKVSISSQMMELMYNVENLHCLGCHTEPTVIGKWWDYLMEPNEKPRDRLKGTSPPHR